MKFVLIKNNIVDNVIEAESITSIPEDIITNYDAVLEVPYSLPVSANWLHTDGSFISNVTQVAPEPPVWQWYIDIGPFFDRFKELKILVLTHPDSTIKALITDIQIRKWIDLELQEVQQALQYIGTVIPQLTSDRILEIINTPVADHENLALRKLYFNA